MSEKKKLIVDNLTVSFRTVNGMVRAVRGVSFDVTKGETLAIVGESGSGKSVSSRAIMGILAGNSVIDDGRIIYESEDLTKIDEEQFHELRGNRIGMIFQDPLSSLNPIMKIGKQITEAMLLNGNRLKNRYRALIQDSSSTVKAKRFAITDLTAKLRSEKDTKEKAVISKELALTKKELREALKSLREDKVRAKATVKQEWNTAKEKAKKETLEINQNILELHQNQNDIKQKLKQASGQQKLDVKKELDAVNSKIREAHEEIGKIKETLTRFKKVTKKEAYERAIEIMTEVGIPEPEKRFKQYPFQFSGGMRQRIVIAIALTANPDVLICDEPTTALDVTIQSQILEMINKLKVERNLTVIFITHDLGVVANIADRVAVMYAGRIVEIGTAEDIFYDPKHPYTWALLSSMPDLESKERLVAIPGTPPNMLFPPEGDAFASRSRYAMKIDFKKQPPMFKVSDTHYAGTWLLHKDAPKVELPKIIKDRIDRMQRNSSEVNR